MVASRSSFDGVTVNREQAGKAGAKNGARRKPERDPATGKFRKVSATQVEAQGNAKGKSAEECVREATERVCKDLPEIVKGIAEKAKEGSYLHAKFLCELARVGEMTLEVEDAGERKPSAAEELLQKLNEMRAEQAAKRQVE